MANLRSIRCALAPTDRKFNRPSQAGAGSPAVGATGAGFRPAGRCARRCRPGRSRQGCQRRAHGSEIQPPQAKYRTGGAFDERRFASSAAGFGRSALTKHGSESANAAACCPYTPTHPRASFRPLVTRSPGDARIDLMAAPMMGPIQGGRRRRRRRRRRVRPARARHRTHPTVVARGPGSFSGGVSQRQCDPVSSSR